MRNYYTVIDKTGAKPEQPIQILTTVARKEALRAQQTRVRLYRSKGWRQTGTTKIETIEFGELSSNSNRKRIELVVCHDLSKVDVLDENGKSVVRKDRPDLASVELLLERDRGTWYVLRDRDGNQTC